MDRMSAFLAPRGFTLVELMIVLVVAAVSLSVATPLMKDTLYRNQLDSVTRRFLSAINLARMESVMRNEPVSICPSPMAQTGVPECSGLYTQGWIVFSNPDKDKVVDAGTDTVLRVFEGLPAGYSLTNRKGDRPAFELINYLPDGSSHNNRTLLFCGDGQSSATSLSIVINIVGRPRLARGWGQCPLA